MPKVEREEVKSIKEIISWINGYLLPENVKEYIYEKLAELILDAYYIGVDQDYDALKSLVIEDKE